MKSCSLGILFSPDKKQILLTRRKDMPLWVLPGGGIDEGESPEQAVIREVNEETGLTVSIKRKTGSYHPLNRLAAPTHIFECTAIGGDIQITSETTDVRYFPLNNLPSNFFFLHGAWLSEALQNLPVPVERGITEITYISLLKYFFKDPLLVFRALIARIKSVIVN